jgi:predicted NUDIX family NTP pyrophosphohydrolase
MQKKSAGIVLYRYHNNLPEIMLVHPGGPFWSTKDLGVWSIPKGEFEENEIPLDAAKRELQEETGIMVQGKFIELTPVKLKSGKLIYAWALEQDTDTTKITSNNFELEWPPKSGTKMLFPEIDRAAWFTFGEAKEKITSGQLSLIIELENKLNEPETVD